MFPVSFKHYHYNYLPLKKQQLVYRCLLDRAWNDRVFQVAAHVRLVPSTQAIPLLPCSWIECESKIDADSGCSWGLTKDELAAGAAATYHRCELGVSSCWPNSLEARKGSSRPKNTSITFGTRTLPSAKEALVRRIKRLLLAAHKKAESWQNVIIRSDGKGLLSQEQARYFRYDSEQYFCALHTSLQL